MEQRGGADEEAPDKQLGAVGLEHGRRVFQIAAESEKAGGKKCGDHNVKAVQPDEFGVFGQILDLGVVGGEVAPAGDPANVRPQKTVDVGRMRILWFVGVLVVMPVMVRPPQRSALNRGAGPECEEKLAEAGGVVGFMGKVPVKNARNRKHPHHIQGRRRPNGEPAPADPDHTETAEMQHDKRNAADEVDAVGSSANHLGRFEGIVGVDPLDERATETPEKVEG